VGGTYAGGVDNAEIQQILHPFRLDSMAEMFYDIYMKSVRHQILCHLQHAQQRQQQQHVVAGHVFAQDGTA
jgi:hypothetical protein